jgi:hypothetical protein
LVTCLVKKTKQVSLIEFTRCYWKSIKKFPNKQAKFNHEERLYTLSSPHKMEKTECTFARFTWQILRSYDRLPSTAITLSIGENQYKAVRPVTPAAAEYGG